MLEKELDYFKKNLNQLRGDNPQGGFVVIKDETILGVWQSRQDAIKEAVEKWGNSLFLVKDLNEEFGMGINYTRNLNFSHGISNDAHQ